MITKVTSANYDAYTLLFNQADTALKEFSGEPAGEFKEADPTFDPNVQYFNDKYEPIEFKDADEFAARTEKALILNEQSIYDLDSYFSRLKTLTEIDYSFLRLPLDEPTFDILDDSTSGRRVIKVPDDFARNGISVQGDETAEILFFSIDRYYDATDLWTEGMNYIIQWKTATKNGVTRAFLNKDGRPFIDNNGKLYFGWPISSEITDEPGNVTFSVRIFRFGNGDTNDEGNPKLAFGLNTQTATVRVNESLTFTITNKDEYKDAINVNKNSVLIDRIVNSTMLNAATDQEAPTPAWNDGTVGAEDHNLLNEEDLAKAISVKTLNKDVLVLATGTFDPEETYYNIDGEIVKDLREVIYRPGVYYTQESVTQIFYEFNYEDVKDKIKQVQAFVSTGIITYTAHMQANPEDGGPGGDAEFIVDNDVIYKEVTDTKRLPNHKYYEYNSELKKYVVALKIATDIGEKWDEADMNFEKARCKFFERISPKLVINENRPVGCYWIVANNNEGRKAMTSIDSYRIWIPGPVELTEEDVVKPYTDEVGYERIKIKTTEEGSIAELSVKATAAANNTIKYAWTAGTDNTVEQELKADKATQTLSYTAEQLPLVDDTYTVACSTERNKATTDTAIERKFRVTAPAYPFVFDTVADTEGEEEQSTDKYKIIIHQDYDENAYTFDIDFSENLDENGKLKMVSDAVAYRFRRRIGGDREAYNNNIFVNDAVPTNYEDGNHFILVDSYEEIPDFVAPTVDHNAIFYCEVINFVNEDIEETYKQLNIAADAVAEDNTHQAWWDNFEKRIARTPYFQVEY